MGKKIASTFDPRVSQNLDRQPLDGRENWHGVGVQACVAAEGGCFRVAQTEHHIVPFKDTTQNTSPKRIRHSGALSTDTDNTLAHPKCPLDPQKCRDAIFTLETYSFFTTVPQMVETTM